MGNEVIVVTRHPALVELLKEMNIINDEVQVVTHVSDPETIKDKIVIGVLPLHLASLAEEVWTINLDLKPEDRGKELTLEELREKFAGIERFKVESLGRLA